MAKQTRLQFPDSTSVSAKVFDLIHADLWRPYMHKIHNNCNMFLTIVDDKSRATLVYLVFYKSHMLFLFQEFIYCVENQFSTTVKVVRTDNGTEFLNQKLTACFADKGIVHQTTCVYTSQQNELVERKHMSLLNIARAIRFQSSLPISFLGDCILTAAYLLNRTPSLLLNRLTPYEILFHTSPDFTLLRTFGCLCYATILPQSHDKFAPDKEYVTCLTLQLEGAC